MRFSILCLLLCPSFVTAQPKQIPVSTTRVPDHLTRSVVLVSTASQAEIKPRHGTGVLVGRIAGTNDVIGLTSKHIFENVGRQTVTFADGTTSPATFVEMAPIADACLFRTTLKGAAATVAPIRTAGTAKEGEALFQVGLPFAGQFGIIERSGHITDIQNDPNGVTAIVTNVLIHPGDSGSPMFGMDGRVVGLTWGGREDAPDRIPNARAVGRAPLAEFVRFACDRNNIQLLPDNQLQQQVPIAQQQLQPNVPRREGENQLVRIPPMAQKNTEVDALKEEVAKLQATIKELSSKPPDPVVEKPDRTSEEIAALKRELEEMRKAAEPPKIRRRVVTTGN